MSVVVRGRRCMRCRDWIGPRVVPSAAAVWDRTFVCRETECVRWLARLAVVDRRRRLQWERLTQQRAGRVA